MALRQPGPDYQAPQFNNFPKSATTFAKDILFLSLSRNRPDKLPRPLVCVQLRVLDPYGNPNFTVIEMNPDKAVIWAREMERFCDRYLKTIAPEPTPVILDVSDRKVMESLEVIFEEGSTNVQ